MNNHRCNPVAKRRTPTPEALFKRFPEIKKLRKSNDIIPLHINN